MGEVSRNRWVRTLPYPKYIKRRDGRCFHCRDPYIFGHCCPDKNLRVIIGGEDDNGLEIGDQGVTELRKKGMMEYDRSLEPEYLKMELSLFLAGGMTQYHTMKLWGRI